MQIEIKNRERRMGISELITRWLINALGLVLVSRILPGVSFEGQGGWQVLVTVLAAAALLGLVNAAIRPVLLVLTLPINLLSLGLFTLFINGAMLWLVSKIVPGFIVQGYGAAVLGALLLSVISMLISMLFRASGFSVKIRKG
jgi:putative membrane protein